MLRREAAEAHALHPGGAGGPGRFGQGRKHRRRIRAAARSDTSVTATDTSVTATDTGSLDTSVTQEAGTAGMEQGGVMGEVARRVLERLARLCGGSGIASRT